MEHPFIVTLEDKTMEELEQAMQSLTTKILFAHRIGNMPLVNQLNMVIESYRKEYNKRMDELFKKQHVENQIKVQ